MADNTDLEAYSHAAPVLAKLVGGLMDGDTVLMIPKGSTKPPVQLAYVGFRPDHGYGMELYESTTPFGGMMEWPEKKGELVYHYQGFCVYTKPEAADATTNGS